MEEIKLANGNTIKIIPTKGEVKRGQRVKSIQIYPITLDYLKENHCVNCQNWHGENHDYNHKSCERCMENIKASQKVFQNR